ncbi:hypothetical protein [Halobellus rufus]|nr:hypothetical protein [Halobellus rufus]
MPGGTTRVPVRLPGTASGAHRRNTLVVLGYLLGLTVVLWTVSLLL